MNDSAPHDAPWKRRGSLAWRILAVNILVVGLLAGSIFYLDGLRSRLIDERTTQAVNEATLMATVLADVPAPDRQRLLASLAAENRLKLRLVDPSDHILAESSSLSTPGFGSESREENSWQRKMAAGLDDGVDFVVRADSPAPFTGFSTRLAAQPGRYMIYVLPDRTHIISASAQIKGGSPAVLLADRNVRDIRRIVRAERSRLGQMVAFAALASILLSLFLARTIVQPLRNIADAAVRVRTGRDREVIVPRLPDRRDEIGLLARAVSDMSHALRQRIDATEAFAADVAHELKNPLASMASAVQSLKTVKKPALTAQLQDIIASDVRRLDRLITDISDLSRIDARLTRMRFEPVDIGRLIADLIAAREGRDPEAAVQIAYARAYEESATVMGVPGQLERVVGNLLDNAISFSPPGGIVRIAATRDGEDVVVMVDDEGPGIPEGAREAIFERFHSDRPESEAFGQHSGLGLSIARTIINGHGGSIKAAPPTEGVAGARLIVRLPAAKPSL
jgi:two-component system, OmpR family, sensor histidine kinase ChvG